MNVHSRPLKVAAVGMGQLTYNTLHLYFSGRGDDNYVLSDENSADIFIIDWDGFQASAILEICKKNHPHQPLIVVSLRDNLEKDVISVRKPIHASALAAALKEATLRLGYSAKKTQKQPEKRDHITQPSRYRVSGEVKDISVNPVSNPVKEKNRESNVSNERDSDAAENPVRRVNSNRHSSPIPVNDRATSKISYFINTERLKIIQEQSVEFLKTFRERSQQPRKINAADSISKIAMNKAGVNDSGIRFVGDLNAIFNPRNPGLTTNLQYNVDVTLQGYVSLAYKIALTSASNVIVEGHWRPIQILYKSREICVERDFRHLFALSAMSFKKEEVSIYGQVENETSMPSGQMMVQPLEQFLWKLALRTSQGRIPEGTDLEVPLTLIRWPNFTRYEVTPHALRIAALWAKRPTSLLETAKILKIPQQYVFAFYSAGYTTGMVRQVAETEGDEISEPQFADGAKRNLCQDLLYRLQLI